MSTLQNAKGKWHSILSMLGVDKSYLVNKHGPCPRCGGKDRFRFDDKNGDGTWYCNQCGSGRGINLVMDLNNWDFKRAASEVDKLIGCATVGKTKTKTDPVIRLKKIAKGLVDISENDPAYRYLNYRGVYSNILKNVRYHPRLEYFEDGELKGFHPAMVALMTSAKETPITYHVTYLTIDGRKANVSSPKKMLSGVGNLPGGAIRLFAVEKCLGVAEGIETALAATKLYGVPCWATGNATLLESFEPPKEIDTVIIYADNDKNYTGQKSAYILANKLSNKLKVKVLVPEAQGCDFADVLKINRAGLDS